MQRICGLCGAKWNVRRRYEEVKRNDRTIRICDKCYDLIKENDRERLGKRISDKQTTRTTSDEEAEFLEKLGIGEIHTGEYIEGKVCEYPKYKGELALEIKEKFDL